MQIIKMTKSLGFPLRIRHKGSIVGIIYISVNLYRMILMLYSIELNGLHIQE